MGIVVVLIFYAIGLTIAASISAGVLVVLATILIRPSTPGRKRVMAACALFPFACVLYAGVWFIGYATINYAAFGRDPGLGDTWQTPLPNGYALIMIDTTDQGTVYDPKTQARDGSISGNKDTVFGVRQLQVADKHIFGARDTGYFDRIGQDSKLVDTYFELNTTEKKTTEFKSLEELNRQASSEGVNLKLREFQSVFGDYRTTWFAYIALLLLLLPPAVGFVLLIQRALKIRRLAT